MFYIKVGDKVRLSEWPRNRGIQVMGIGGTSFIGKDLKDGVLIGDEQMYYITDDWQLIPEEIKFPITTMFLAGEHGHIGYGVLEENKVVITLNDTPLAISFVAMLKADIIISLSIEPDPEQPRPE